MNLIPGENSNWLSFVADKEGTYKYKFKIVMKDGSKVIKEVEVKVNAAYVDESKKKEQVGNKFASILMGKANQNKTDTNH